MNQQSVLRPLVSSFWLSAWAVALAWSWLLPNHYQPWTAFHMDAWAAAVSLAMSAAVLLLTRGDTRSSLSVLVVVAVMALPWLQYASGMIAMAGTAWLAFAYLLALALAIETGQRWESRSAAQVGDGLFLAIGVAAIASVGMQLHQWQQLTWTEIWSMGQGHGRPYANFGQPNQLGTLLLWGLLAVAWGVWRKRIRLPVALLASVFLLFGLALTASRTAWIAVLMLTVASWYWRGLSVWRPLPRAITGLAVLFMLFVWMIPNLTQLLLLATADDGVTALSGASAAVRLQLWSMLLAALEQQPWTGYGWNQNATAQLATAADFPPLHVLFTYAHNLFMDLVIWNGAPLGLAISLLIVAWFWRRFRAIRDPGSALLLLLLAVVGNHAMLELPLHYAYFLIPVGLVVGALEVRTGAKRVSIGYGWMRGIAWLVAGLLFATLVRDYARVEASYEALRFEWANFRPKTVVGPPDVLVLGQMRDLIVLSRFEPSADMEPAQIEWMRHVANLYPSAGVIHKLAVALAWNQQPAEAALWLRRMCAIVPTGSCAAVTRSWKQLATTDKRVAAVQWP